MATQYIEPTCYRHPFVWKQHLDQACSSSVIGASIILLPVLFLLTLACKLQTIAKTYGKLASLEKRFILHYLRIADLSHLYGIVKHGIANLVIFFARFPFRPNQVNKWFALTRKDGVDGDVQVNAINIDVAGKAGKLYTPQYDVAFPDGLADDEHRLFYHGTSHDGALSILRQGIMLSEGTKTGDFSSGNGFYLTDNFNTALDWASSKYKHQPAVLIYKFSNSNLGKFEGLDLFRQDARDQWNSIIRTCRSGIGLPTAIRKKKSFIEGPMATVSRKGEIQAIKRSYQLCILSEAMAENFDESIHSMFFTI